VTLAYDVADAAFNHVWHDPFVTWTIADAICASHAELPGVIDRLAAG
jgi:hypothetical protein